MTLIGIEKKNPFSQLEYYPQNVSTEHKTFVRNQ